MKNFLTVLTLMGLGAAYTFATPSSCSTMAPNSNLIAGSNGTLTGNNVPPDTYEPCTIGPLTFSNFSYFISGSFDTSPQVTTEVATYANGLVNFGFDPQITSGSDLELEYQITGGVSGVSLSINGLTGTGSINEVICTVFIGAGQTCASAGGTTLGTINYQSAQYSIDGATPTMVTVGSGPDVTASFASTQTVWIYKDIEEGNNTFSEVNQDYVTPEPVTTSLVGIGLLGIGLWAAASGSSSE